MPCRILLLLFAVAGAIGARAADRTVVTSAGTTIDARGQAKLTHARLTDGELLLTADEFQFSANQRDVFATGRVVLTYREFRLLADELVYHRADGSFAAKRVRLGAFPYFAEGESASGTTQEITLVRATATYGEPSPWRPAMIAEKIIYAPGQRLRTENSRIGIGHAQPVPLPQFTQSLREPFIAQVSLTGGFRRSLGAFAEAGLQLPTPQAGGLKLGGNLGLYTSRGLMFGPACSYARTDAGADLHGWFRSSYINDHGDKKTDLLGRPVPEDRAYVEWQHTQQLGPGLTLNAQLEWWRDSEVLRDFRPRAFFPVQQPDTFAEATYAGKNHFISLFTRYQPNNFGLVQERLPELRFDLLPLAVGGGFYARGNASVALLRESPLRGLPREESTRFDAYYALTRPVAIGDWLAFAPIAGARLTTYAGSRVRYSPAPIVLGVPGATAPPAFATFTPGNHARTVGELGFDAALRTSGTFDYKNTQWRIDGLRHLLTPRLSYRYLPGADHGRGRIPPIDRQAFATYLQPLGLGDMRHLDDLRATNTLRLGFDNTLQTRDSAYGSRDLVVLNVASDFRFRRAPGERTASEIHTELALAPARWLEAGIYQSFTPHRLTLREFNSAVTLRDGDRWSVRFASNLLRRQIEDYAIDGRFRLHERFDALTRLHYDARKRRFTEQAYGLAQNLDNTWRVSYVVSLYEGRARESRFGLNLQVEAVGF